MLPLVIQIERTEEHKADTCAFLQSPVRIGRNPLNDLQLDESFVSQWHGVIRFGENQTAYLDLGSTNPTLLDGQPISRNVEIPITETSDLRIGSLRLHLLRVSAPPELFGVRRKTAFARTGSSSDGAVAKTMFLQPEALSAMISGLASKRLAGMPSEPAPKAAPAPASLQEAYRHYRSGFSQVLSGVRAELEHSIGDERSARVDALLREFPEISHEAELRSLLDHMGVSPLRTGVPEMADWLNRLTDGLFPPPGVPINVALAMERIGEVLEVFSTSFVEMRKGHSQFCEEMSLEKLEVDSLLHTTENPSALLAYLLNPGKEGSVKVTELSRALADFAVHQVALVSAVVQGARDLLDEISPQAFESGGATERPGFFGKLFAKDKNALWERYVGVFGEAVDEDRFTRKLFGRGFARKYYAITGGRRSLPPPQSER